MVESLFGRFASMLVRRRVAVGALFLFTVAGVCAGALRLEADFSARAFFGGDDGANAALDRFQAVFGPDDNVIVAVAKCVDCGEAGLLTSTRLERLRELTEALAAVPGVDRTLSLTNLPLPQAGAAGALDFSPTGREVPDKPLLRSAFKARLVRDEALVPVFLSKDASAAAVMVAFGEAGPRGTDADERVDPDDVAAVRALTERLRAVAAEHVGDSVDVALTGTPVIRADLLGLILHDQIVFVPVAFGLMALLLFVLYRRFFGVLLPLLAAALPAALVMGVMGYVGEPIGVVNQVYFTLLPVIAVSGAIHLLSRYYFEAHHLGVDDDTLRPHHRDEAVILAVRRAGGPILFSGLTTVIGLLSLQLSGMPILQSFGVYSSIGVCFAIACTLIFLPLVLSATRGRALLGPAGEGGVIDVVLGRCADVSRRHPGLMVGLGVAVFAACAALAQTIVVDNTLTGMIGPGHRSYQAGQLVDDELGGLVALELHVTGEPGLLDDPAVLRALQKIEERAAEEPGVRSVQGPASLLARLSGVLLGDDEAARSGEALPEDKRAAAQLWFLSEGHPLRRDVADDKRAHGRLQVRAADVGGDAMVAMRDRVGAYARQILDEAGSPAATSAQIMVTGTALTSYLGINRLADDMKRSVFWAFVIIVIVMTGVLGSLRMGLVAVLPNGLPLALGAGLLAVLGWHLEPGPAVVFTVAIGIAVDDTIHILFRYREARSEGEPKEASIRRAVVHSGRPVVITTVILAAGFGVHVASAFPTNARVGVLGAFVIFAALIADLFVLPAVMRLVLPNDAKGADPPRGAEGE